jgi:hypothetical protein
MENRDVIIVFLIIYYLLAQKGKKIQIYPKLNL